MYGFDPIKTAAYLTDAVQPFYSGDNHQAANEVNMAFARADGDSSVAVADAMMYAMDRSAQIRVWGSAGSETILLGHARADIDDVDPTQIRTLADKVRWWAKAYRAYSDAKNHTKRKEVLEHVLGGDLERAQYAARLPVGDA